MDIGRRAHTRTTGRRVCVGRMFQGTALENKSKSDARPTLMGLN